MDTISNIFFNNAQDFPDKIAIWCDGKVKTYRELATMVDDYSKAFIINGIKYGDHIGVPMSNSIESVVLILAAAKTGVGLVPINPTLPLSAIKIAFEAAGVKHLIASKSFLKQMDHSQTLVRGKTCCIDGRLSGITSLLRFDSNIGDILEEVEVNGDEILIITMTSGSTGKPKPIILTQRIKYDRAIKHMKLYNISEEDRILAATPLYHSLAERLVLMPLLAGATSILLPRFTPNIWLKCIKEQNVTFTIAVSAQLSQVAELLSSPFVPDTSSLRCVVSSSALLETNVKNELIEKLGCQFREMYGTSEVSTATDINFQEAMHKKKSVGKPLPGVDIKIVNDSGEAPAGKIGEIACKTPLLCKGYYGLEETFEESLYHGYFKTGDLGYVDSEGYLYYSGRKKELIITGGINVYPSDIENCIRQMSGVQECAVFSFPDERLGEVVATAVVKKQEENISKRDIQIQCARNLADFQQPHKIFFVKELPVNAMGKLMRNRLYEFVKINEIGNVQD